MNISKRDNQELKDYNTAKQIFQKLFPNPTIKKMDDGLPTDMRFTVTTSNDVYKYNVEIKSRNQSMTDYDTLPLTCAKYCNIVGDTHEDEKPIIIYLVNGEDYFVFNLATIDWNKVECRNWYINKVEYSVNGSQKVKTPTFFLPVSQCVYNGLIS